MYAAAQLAFICAISTAYADTPEASAPRQASSPTSLGVQDRGIWADLDSRVELTAPAAATRSARVTLDPRRRVAVLWIDGWPVKPYPLRSSADAEPQRDSEGLPLTLRPGDRAELAGLVTADRVGPAAAVPDRDDDGIPDPLDVLIGGKKAVLNADAYTTGYVRIGFPGGDVPRTMGVCTDVVIRALRNAGLDLQAELHRDIRREPRAYPMVKRPDPNIDHRRVRTLLPYFLRHFDRRSAAVGDPADPLRPGDIVLLDTIPLRPGPDHIGLVSDRRGATGLPLVINNWTVGARTAEMDLLGWVAITHRFRLRGMPTR